MKRYLLDTSALLTLRDDEMGANQVAELLGQARQHRVQCFACFLTLMEIFYRVWRDEGEAEGRLAYEQCQALPLNWIHEDKELLEMAASIKANYQVSLADAWIGAAAILQNAQLVHKDPEFEALDCDQLPLPYKGRQ
ncbi:MAG: type II toxin-antitoxin system VapC family toxin [Deltaproteobacteria bacterium]|nr:type II toxin-antitoxin system VapC family toxin [Deltaproteobacteria bacterium]NCP03126.1 type II toxin-antitoxin system VapC family toxin [Deltaproteobacteria bacterium]